MSDLYEVSRSTLKILLESIYNDETEVPLESHPPKEVASDCLLTLRKEVLTRFLLIAIDGRWLQSTKIKIIDVFSQNTGNTGISLSVWLD